MYSAAVILDNISWFEKTNPLPALAVNHINDCKLGEYDVDYNADYGFYQSNCIVLDKRFDWGKYNPIHVRIEVTPQNEGDDLLDDSIIC